MRIKEFKELACHAEKLAAALAECLRETQNNMKYETRKATLKSYREFKSEQERD